MVLRIIIYLPDTGYSVESEENMKLVGFRKGQFTTNENKVIEYANVYFLDKNPNVDGEIALSYKATLDVVDSLKNVGFGTDVNIYFDQYKRVNLVVPVGK